MVESNNRQVVQELKLHSPDLKGSWVSTMMYRLRDESVTRLADMFREDLKRPEWVGREPLYYKSLNVGLAALLDSTKGKDQHMQQIAAHYVAHMLEAELQARTTESAPISVRDRGADGVVLPEDRVLNALASLLEGAKGKEASHQSAIANAAASIADSIWKIKALRNRSNVALGQIPSPVTPKPAPRSADATKGERSGPSTSLRP